MSVHLAVDQFHSETYFAARHKFNAAAEAMNCRTEKYMHPSAAGRDHLPLYTDVAIMGAQKPAKLLVNVSGLYGIDGRLGSAIQIAALQDHVLEIPDDTAVVSIHAINSWGFEHGLVMPKYWTPPPSGLMVRRKNRFARTQASFLSGQLRQADGFLHRDSSPRLYWPRTILDKILSPYRESARHLIQINSQPSLGEWSKSKIILESGKSAQYMNEAQKIWSRHEISVGEDHSASHPLAGFYDDWINTRCIVATHEIGVAKHAKAFGQDKTNARALMKSFRKKNPDEARRAIREVFCPNDVDWWAEALVRGLLTFNHALLALKLAG